MFRIGNMLWRIGELLDFEQQLAWIRDAGFDGIGFHASAGIPGEWCGIEPSACDAKERERLRQEIDQFSFSEIHAPFEIVLRSESLSSDTARLKPVLDLAQDLGVAIVTVHPERHRVPAGAGLSQWLGPMEELNVQATRAQTMVALEVAEGFDVVASWELSNVGVNLDVGHMHLSTYRQTLQRYGGIRNLIRHLGDLLVHLHVHDVNGNTDHIEIGAGCIDFDEMTDGLKDIGYSSGMCLEMNPNRVSPEGIRRSKEYLQACFKKKGIE